MSQKIRIAVLLLALAFSLAGSPPIRCAGAYPGHLQGFDSDGKFLYWSFTTRLVKTDLDGKLIAEKPVKSHHGDLCVRDGKLYVAVNLGKFNQETGADNVVAIYRTDDLAPVAEHPLPEVVHGAGGIAWHNGSFWVVGGLPKGYEENYVYQYTEDFKFIKRHTIASGYTQLGIQTACYAAGNWYFGCYGNVTLQCDEQFKLIRQFKFNTAVGLLAMPDDAIFAAVNTRESDPDQKVNANRAVARQVLPDPEKGFATLPE